ncbi:E3 ubiquitin-protein ligase ATL41-like [Quillaja saponaria]|uniref:RING-type E3 ubiquitin transferase n=1 Tax=Quillaja saponaria TaxID=32244 RepID=A0AAD7LVC4_QUISA|nr:E3 ubiquitin-protein ligase ATL41-like [Quillaja saponaria]
MDELQIAISKAELLHRLSNWGRYSTFDGSYDPRLHLGELEEEELQSIRLDTMTAELALSRTRLTNQDFKVVLREVEFKVMIELAKILEKTQNSGFEGTKEVEPKVFDETDELMVCGVCQEEMKKDGDESRVIVGCNHKFHSCCIWKWFQVKSTCPWCRYQIKFKTKSFL